MGIDLIDAAPPKPHPAAIDNHRSKKPLGIVLFSWVAVRLGVARLPEGVGWGALAGGGCLAGIGFTMALFIARLALEGSSLDAAKMGILGGSIVSGILGMVILRRTLPPAENLSKA